MLLCRRNAHRGIRERHGNTKQKPNYTIIINNNQCHSRKFSKKSLLRAVTSASQPSLPSAITRLTRNFIDPTSTIVPTKSLSPPPLVPVLK